VSRWRDPAVLARAPYLRSERNKGIRRAAAEARRAEAEARNKATPPERRRRWRQARGEKTS
jgi:hypothetical protein